MNWRRIAIKALIGLVGLAALIYAAFYLYNQGLKVGRAECAQYRIEAAAQIAKLTQTNLEVNERIVIEYVDRVNTIREKQVVYRDVIREIEPQFRMTNGWVHIHDAAATTSNIDPQVANDKTLSSHSDVDALSTVVGNYGTCEATRAQLESLQKWIRDMQSEVAQSNEERRR